MLDLFSGIGGFSLAASWTGGIETVAFCEIEPYCQKVLHKHWPDVPIYPDIKQLRGEDIGSVDIVCGGFPCQPFSCAGKQRGKEDDRYLWPEMFRVIQETKPTWVIGENVANFVNMGLDDCVLDLESEGYEVQPFIIPACAVNAPHRRDRVWIVAHTEGRNDRGRSREIQSKNEQQAPERQKEWLAEPCGTSEDVSNADRQGLQARRCEIQAGRSIVSGHDNVAHANNRSGPMRRDGEFSTASQTKRSRGNYRGGTAQYVTGEWWAVEPDVGRVANGIPHRVDRLKGCGNAIVPQVVYPILQGIVDIEKQLRSQAQGRAPRRA